MSGPLRTTLARAGRAFVRPEGERWAPECHFATLDSASARQTRAALGWLVRHRGDLQWLWGRLDDPGRRVLADVLAHRLGGSGRVAHGIDREEVAALTRFAAAALDPRHERVDGSPVEAYDLSALGSQGSVLADTTGFLQVFVVEQYHCASVPEANVRPGDHVLDAGAFCGETARWYAERCGPGGRVTAFEPAREQLGLLEANLALAGHEAGSVRVRAEALWDREGEVPFEFAGPMSSVVPEGTRTVPAVRLDTLVAAGEIESVDLIKLDVEGAELRALQGAEQTVRRERPRLAVAVYHRWNDVVAIPRWLASVEPSYRFALAHRSVNPFETMLFAWSPQTG